MNTHRPKKTSLIHIIAPPHIEYGLVNY